MGGMELNKIFAAVLLAGVIAMGSGFLAELLLPVDELDEAVIFVDVETEPETTVALAEEPAQDFLALLATADPGAGQSVFRRCSACHTVDQGGRNGVGPNLWDVVGGPKAHLDGFNYSDPLQAQADAGGVWGFEELNGFLANPGEWTPGTSMSFAGLRNIEDRADVIAYLRSLSDDPVPLPQ